MFENLLNYDNKTVVLYFAIIFSASILACISERFINSKKQANSFFGQFVYCLSFFIVAFYACFRGVGRDMTGYALIFTGENISAYNFQIEPGFYLIVLIIRIFTSNPDVFNGLISLFTLIFVYCGIYKWKNKLPIGLAITVFSFCYYLQSYNLMRMYFAMSIVLYFSYLLKENKNKYIIVMLIASSIHFSIIFCLFAVLIGIYFEKKQKIGYKTKLVLVFSIVGLVGVLLTVFANLIMILISRYYSRYSFYTISKNSIGLGIIWDFIPFALALAFAKYSERPTYYRNVVLGYVSMEFLTSLLSYSIEIVGRAKLTLNVPVVILLPFLFQCFKKQKNNGHSVKILLIGNRCFYISYFYIKALFILYLFIYLLIYMNGYLVADGIEKYKFIWA